MQRMVQEQIAVPRADDLVGPLQRRPDDADLVADPSLDGPCCAITPQRPQR